MFVELGLILIFLIIGSIWIVVGGEGDDDD